MAQDNTVSFKAYLLQGDTNEKSEVRRFGIDRDVVSSFDYLKGKLQHIFPALRNQNFSVFWKDAENDNVVISSDDELMIALAEMQNEVRKLYIKLLRTSANSPDTEAGLTYEAADPTHKDVICDVCDQQIEGFRYHCTECFDYDLCGNCEAKKMHREHIMIRLPEPVPTHLLNPFLGRVMAHLEAAKGHHGHGRDRRHHHDEHKQSSSAEKGKQNVSAEKKREKMKIKQEKFLKTHGRKAEYLRSVGHKIAEFLDPLGIDVDVEVLTRDENENKNEEGKKGEENMETEETEKDEVQKTDPKCSMGEGSNKAGPSQAPEACVANPAGQSVRSNPEIDDWTVLNALPAEQQNRNPPEPTAIATSANQVQNETEKPTSSTDHVPIQVGAISGNQAQGGAGEPSTSKTAAHVYQGVGTTGMPSSGAGAATYIGTGMPIGANVPIYTGLRMPTSGANNVPIYVGAGTTVPSSNAPYYTNLYPTIPPFYYQSPNQPVQPRQNYSTYSRPNVADAVQKMMAMGFSNEGGWLTQLLEIKNGDIEKALDVLQPVKRS